MPRYFFHVKDGQTFLDNEGSLLANLEEVRAEAIRASGEMLKDSGRNFWGGTEWRMWVTDEANNTVCTMTFSAE